MLQQQSSFSQVIQCSHTHTLYVLKWLIILHLYLFSYKAHNFVALNNKTKIFSSFILRFISLLMVYGERIYLSLFSLFHAQISHSAALWREECCQRKETHKNWTRKKVREKFGSSWCVRVYAYVWVSKYYCGFRQISECTLYSVWF